MHAQAQPERPEGEGHGWPEFYSPQMRGKWWSDIEFSLSRLSTAQTPCLAPTIFAKRASSRPENSPHPHSPAPE